MATASSALFGCDEEGRNKNGKRVSPETRERMAAADGAVVPSTSTGTENPPKKKKKKAKKIDYRIQGLCTVRDPTPEEEAFPFLQRRVGTEP